MSDQLATVDPATAIEQTDNWRNYYALNAFAVRRYEGQLPPDPVTAEEEEEIMLLKKEAFRGFRIPLSDLKEITRIIDEYNKAEEHKEKINSVRVYLAKSSPDPKTGGDVHIYLVPNVGGPESIETPPPGSTLQPDYGHDLITFGGHSAIYDFSAPCPKQCDTRSPLYDKNNLQ